MNVLEQTSPRVSISVADPDILSLDRYPCEGTGVIRACAIGDTAGKTLTLRVVLYDSRGVVVGVSGTSTFTADSVARYNGKFLATPVPDAYFPTGGATSFSVEVVSVSGGNWTVNPLAY